MSSGCQAPEDYQPLIISQISDHRRKIRLPNCKSAVRITETELSHAYILRETLSPKTSKIMVQVLISVCMVVVVIAAVVV